MTDNPDPVPSDKPKSKFVRENWYRDLWMLALTALILLSLKGGQDRINEIQSGRQLGTKISCGTTQAFLQANQRTIEAASQPHETPTQERAIEALGFGNKAERVAKAKTAGRAYVLSVQAGIVLFAGPRAADIIELPNKTKPTATINCAHLQRLIGVPH